ncbi:F-box protein [Camellia lanceoleosa]|uniref:F-box protein n=1 Tax=Camellia lanceoleosa TaxID=1840588 RepID=A0ACC0GYI0_9ERIC|nr:F-box protein [Camellia lanceoleosa]
MSDYIPPELLIDILTRLPAETLVRFTLVCRSWYSLITTPSFISHHLNRTISNPNNTHLLLRYCTEDPIEEEHYSLRFDDPITNTFNEYAKLKFPFTFIDPPFGIVGSCNGLICISDDQACYNHGMFLWNPLIRKSLLIPYANVRFRSHGPFMHSLGFGFDSVSNDFKVVRIVHIGLDCDRVPPEVELYTLKTGIWRNISDKALSYIVVARSRQAYINGVSHWVAHTPRYGGIFRNLIVSFDMNDEVFREIFISRWQIRIDLSSGLLRKPIGMRKNGEVLLGTKCDIVPPEVEIYTLKTGFWRIISDKALPYIVEERLQQAYINGVAHWVARTPMDVGSFRMIVSFNMNDEVFREISCPDGIAGEEKLMERMSLVVFEETLCLIQHCQYHDDPHCLIWMMKKNGVVASWVKQFRIDLCGGLRKPIGMRKNGQVLVVMKDGYLVSYDPKSKQIMNLGIVGFTDLYCYHSFVVDTYTASLVLLDKGVDFL